MKTEVTQNIVRTLQGRKERLYQLRVMAFFPKLKKTDKILFFRLYPKIDISDVFF